MNTKGTIPKRKVGEPKLPSQGTQSAAKGKKKFERRIATMRVNPSEFTRLENYILGGSAAIITNVSLIVGLGSARAGRGPILGGLLTLALADNISDSLGIHLYKESEGCGERLSGLATALNFLSRLLVSISFIAIVLIFPTSRAIVIGIVWALLLITFTSYLITRSNHKNSVLEIIRHVLVAVVVIVLSRWVGCLIADHFS